MRRGFPGLRKLFLFAGDMAIVAAASYAAMFIVTACSGAKIDQALYQGMLPVMLSVVGILLIFNGLVSLTRKKYIEAFIDLAIVMIKMFVIMMAISFFMRDFAYSRSILIVAALIQFVALALWNRFWWQIEHNTMILRKVLIMGGADDCHSLVSSLYIHDYLKDYVKYICPDYESGQWKEYMADVDLVILSSDMKLSHKAACFIIAR